MKINALIYVAVKLLKTQFYAAYDRQNKKILNLI